MANISTLACPVCPHCGVENVSFVYVASADSYNGEPYLHLWKCGNCNKGLCTEGYTSIISGGNNIRDFTDVYPHHQEIVAPYGTPDTMASSYRTAIRCLRAGKDADYEAACVMARRCIELAVNDIGGEGHNLFQKGSVTTNG